MNNYGRTTKGYLAVMTLAMLAQVACTQPDTDPEEVAETQQGIVTANAVTANAVTANAVTANAVTANALLAHALTTDALATNTLVKNALTDPLARELLTYVVSCALPEDEQISVSVQGVTYTFSGSLGLAPEWGQQCGSCDSECQSWVSGCVISRLDYLGESLDISIRGKKSGLHSNHDEREDFPNIEATYYGNIFQQPQKIFACLPPGKTSIPRVCGPSLDDCIVEVQGNCEDLCGNQKNDGSYPNCRQLGAPKKKHGGYHKGPKHVGSVTVFLAD
jgi:hypothetical protein